MQKKTRIKYIEIRPIYNILKEYIGTNDINLTYYANFEQFSDHEFPLIEHISIEKIKELIGKHFDVDIADDVVKVLWLNANVNYKRNYNKVEEAYEHWVTEYCTDDIDWVNIEKEVLELYLLINKNKSNSAQPISIKIGKVKKITLENTLGWFTHFLNNHCFAKIDPPINSVENALKRLKEHNNSSVGAKVKDKIKNAMVYGIANLAHDYNLVTENAPKNLCEFIREYLEEMEIVEKTDTITDTEWIKAQIRNLSTPSKSPRTLDTPELETCSLESLEESDKSRKNIDFLTKE